MKIATFTLLICLFFVASNADGGGTMVGAPRQIENVKSNKEVQELGRFSVAEYNRRQHKSHLSNGGGELQFVEVVEAKSQVVSGIKYFLKVSALRNGAHVLYDSEVVVKPWLRSKELVNFAPQRPN